MNLQIRFDCGSNSKESEYKKIIHKHTEYIMKLEKDLIQYKAFHDAILNNNAISDQFNTLNDKIKKLEKENEELKNK